MSSIKSDLWRQAYHLMPKVGWLNDPNGACYFQGTYHIYHQYVPDNVNGGATHWGHKTSKDLVHFKEEEIFLSPDQPYDKDGVYSGSAIEVDNKLHFFYTGNVKQPGDYDYLYTGREQNVVHVVSPDGYSVERREVVIPHSDFPKDFTAHIRDPKLFERDGMYYMALGGRKKDNTGAILLYESHDLDEWTYAGNLLEGTIDQGYMWECPDLFELDDKVVLIFSPQGIQAQPNKFLNPHAACYLIGEINWKTKTFLPETDFQELDLGFDFYAPQTFSDGSRRLLWGWMGIGDTSPEYIYPTVSQGWQHCLTMPRQLKLVGDKLYQEPIEEYQQIRTNHQHFKAGKNHNLTSASETYELLVSFTEKTDEFSLQLRQDTKLIYKDQLLILEHGPSGYGRRRRYAKLSNLQNIRIFSDHSSLELFINKGEVVMSTRVFPSQTNGIDFKADALVTLDHWLLDLNKGGD